MSKIAVLVSGGVDSSVALALLKEQGHELVAFYLKIWLEDELAYLGSCPWEQDLEFAKGVCDKLNIPLQVVSMQQKYHEQVVSYMLAEIKQGRTPNPDVLCNQQIKFGAFYEAIDDSFDYVATGHYAQVEHLSAVRPDQALSTSSCKKSCMRTNFCPPPFALRRIFKAIYCIENLSRRVKTKYNILKKLQNFAVKKLKRKLVFTLRPFDGAQDGNKSRSDFPQGERIGGKATSLKMGGMHSRPESVGSVLKKGKDPVKDQTYFLTMLSQEQLSRALFPIGCYEKHEVRELAAKYDLPTQSRKDSQGICFLGKFEFSEFLKAHLGVQEGDIIEFESGKVLGQHYGFWFYTIGQRQGLGLSGGPWYVVCKDPAKNIVFISKNYKEIATYKSGMIVNNFHWIDSRASTKSELDVRFRHGPAVHPAIVTIAPNATVTITLNVESSQGIATGQFAVLYDGDVCLGGGIIDCAF